MTQELIVSGHAHGDCMTVTGKTWNENLVDVKTVSEMAAQTVLYPVANPVSPAGNHLLILQGNLATESAVLKLSGKIYDKFQGYVCFHVMATYLHVSARGR